MAENDFGLKGSVIAITGGSSGIGLAAALRLLGLGAKVAICGRDAGRLRAALAELEGRAGADHVLAYSCDVLSETQVSAFAQRVSDKFGGIDVLVNNAGRGRTSTFADTSDTDWEEELNLKFFSLIRPIRAFLTQLKRSDRASIVCVNSLLAVQPEPHMVATSAARAGVLNLAHSLAVEFAPQGIRVNSLLLGTIDSGQWSARYQQRAPQGVSYGEWLASLAQEKRIPLGRFGAAEEAANAIAFLASPVSSYTTGATIDVSGGIARRVG
jgi:NAD(P)-dependent dehydrogenase (short-subunit alcohol dehydrogenase family)